MYRFVVLDLQNISLLLQRANGFVLSPEYNENDLLFGDKGESFYYAPLKAMTIASKKQR